MRIKIFFALATFLICLQPSGVRGETSARYAWNLFKYLIAIDHLEDAEDLLNSFTGPLETDEVRFEKAKLFYKTGRNEEGEGILRDLIAKNISNPLLTDQYFRILEQNKSGKLNFSYSYKTLKTRNPNKRAKSGTYNLFGWELDYENEEDKNYWGLQHNLTAILNLGRKLNAAGYVNFTDYEGRFADRAGSSLKVSSMQFGYLKPNPFFEWESNWQESYRDNTFSLGLLQRFRSGIGATDLELSLGDIQADKSEASSGNRYGLELSFRPILKSSSVTIYGFHTRFDLNGATLKNQISGIGGSYQKRFSRYLGSISGRYFDREFDNIDFVWGKRRADETWNVSGEICRLMNQKASLCFNLGYEETKSSIGFYDNESPEYGIYVKGVGF